MPLSQILFSELKHEASNTKKVLERVPVEHWDWKPHEKSYSIGPLAAHLAQLTSWLDLIINADELDLAKRNSTQLKVTNSTELMQSFEDHIEKAKAVFQNNITDEDLMKSWSLKNGDKVFFTLPKLTALRSMVFNHIVHHRAQLGVYLRLLDIPVPVTYGPTADEQVM